MTDAKMATYQFRSTFNGKIITDFLISISFISVLGDVRIEKEKREIYKKMNMMFIPEIRIIQARVHGIESNRTYVEFLNGNNETSITNGFYDLNIDALKKLKPSFCQPNSGNMSHDGILFDMMLEATIDNGYNYDFANYLRTTNLTNIFPIEDSASSKEDRKFNANISIPNWKAMTWEKFKILMEKLQNSGTKPQLSLQSWTPYVRKILLEKKESRFYSEEKSGDIFKIDNYDFKQMDLRDKVFDWSRLMKDYRIANPNKKEGSNDVSMSARPYDYFLFNSEFINFVVYDRESKKIAAYIVCSLKSLTKSRQFKPSDDFQFRSEEPRLLKARLDNNNNKDLCCGYDLFCIEAIHVSGEYRGKRLSSGATLSKTLIFCAMQFIQLAHKTLGVKMVLASSMAVQTMQILVGTFGFSHYNKYQESIWLWSRFVDYTRAREGSKRNFKFIKTKIELLTLVKLREALQAFQKKYSDELLEGPIEAMRILADTHTEGIIESGEKTLPVRKNNNERTVSYKDVFDNVRIALSYSHEDPYMKSMRVFLEAVDNEDTFLYLAHDNGPSESFLRKMASFPLTRPTMIEIEDDDGVGDIGDVINQTDVSGKEIVGFVNPTEDEMILYERVIALLGEEEKEESGSIDISIDEDIVKSDEEEIHEISFDDDNNDEEEEEEIKKLKKQIIELTKERNSENELITKYKSDTAVINAQIQKLVASRGEMEKKVRLTEKNSDKITKRIEELEALVKSEKNEKEKKPNVLTPKQRYNKLRNEYWDSYENISDKLQDNYLEYRKDALIKGADNVLVARKDLRKKLEEIGYDKWPDNFKEWIKEQKERKMIFKDVVQKLKALFPKFLDYVALEEIIRKENEDVIMGELMRNYMEKFSLHSKEDERETNNIMSNLLSGLGLCVKRDTKKKIYTELKSRFPHLLHYDRVIV